MMMELSTSTGRDRLRYFRIALMEQTNYSVPVVLRHDRECQAYLKSDIWRNSPIVIGKI